MVIRITRRGLLAGAAALTVGGVSWNTLPVSGQSAGAATRTNHALLVAVTAYPELPPRASLVGPNNDAALVRQFLTQNAPIPFAAENITVLADVDETDGMEADGSPTREAIRAALDALADKVAEGDFVYLHFSGHGAQQPAMDPALEPDGLDEIFLPRDTAPWRDRSQGVPNALIDKEIRDHLQAIRDRGAFIWAVFDCCHSGTMTRALVTGDEEVDRKIAFTDLGIPETAMAEAMAGSEGATRGIREQGPRQNALGLSSDASDAGPAAPGGMVAFFAAQTTETTPEMRLPRGAEDAVQIGLFTHTLYSRIAENPAVTYRQLGQAILQHYSGLQRTRPTPLFEGDLDRPVFGMTDTDRIAQWPIRIDGGALEIPAGQLHGLSRETKLAVLPTPGSTIDDALGFVEVTAARNLTSRIVPVALDGLPALAVADIPAGAYARLTELSIGFELVVARPEGGDFPAEAERLNAALERIVAEENAPVNLRLVEASEAADLKLVVMSEMDVGIMIADQAGDDEEAVAMRASLGTEPRVWLLPPSAELSLDVGRRAPSLPVSDLSVDELADDLAENLVSFFRATALSQLAVASDFRPQQVDVSFKVWRDDTGDTEPLRAGVVPVVHPDDQVHLHARNSSSQPVDINVLFVASDYSIDHMYAERLHSGSEIDLPLLAFTDTTYGVERMIVVLSEAPPLSAVEDLSFLAQVGVRQATRSAGVMETFGDLLRDVANAPTTRGAARIGERSGARGAVIMYQLETMPRG